MSITGIGINDAFSSEIPDGVRDFLEEGTQVVVVLEMTVSNDSAAPRVDLLPQDLDLPLVGVDVDGRWRSCMAAG